MQQTNKFQPTTKPRFFLKESGAETYKVYDDGTVQTGSLLYPELWFSSILKPQDIEEALSAKEVIEIFKRGVS